jgi:hypothetical protein
MDGLEADGTVSFDREGTAEGQFPAASEGGPQTRTADPGTKVIDLTAMRAELEQKRGGE